MALFKNKKTRALISIMFALVLSVIIYSRYHYKSINESIDPRVVPARNFYEKYNNYALLNQFDSIFFLMDTIESIYTRIEHYKNSYEMGVIHTNRAAVYLTIIQQSESIDSDEKDSLLNLAEAATLKSISIYENWLSFYTNKNEQELIQSISSDFFIGFDSYSTEEKNIFLENRLKEIEEAKVENERRLSISVTNLGVVFSKKGEYDSAAVRYKQAIDFWDQNYTARNNLNQLLGLPLEKRTFIQKLFPPEKN